MIAPRLVAEMAAELGFDVVRFGQPDLGDHAEHFARWLDAGRAGDMDYLHRNRAKITAPGAYAPGARSVIALASDYGGPAAGLHGGGRIARYAVGRDYHRAMGNATRRLRGALEREGVPQGSVKVGTDAVPVLERALSVGAGVGFLAKSSMVISAQHGPYLLLSELLTPLELPPDDLAPGSCGTCTRCLDACPTQAITAPFEVDARRCLSYTTIELRGYVPRPLRAPQGDWLFGCDICIEVCPYTRFSGRGAPSPIRAELVRPHAVVDTFTLVGVLELSEADYEQQWVGTAMRRATRQGLRRNAAIVLGNRREEAAIPSLSRALADQDPIVRGHAAWALGRIAPRSPTLKQVLEREPDAMVRAEIMAALAEEP